MYFFGLMEGGILGGGSIDIIAVIMVLLMYGNHDSRYKDIDYKIRQ